MALWPRVKLGAARFSDYRAHVPQVTVEEINHRAGCGRFVNVNSESRILYGLRQLAVRTPEYTSIVP
jgi:hypothetical protein